MFSLRLRAALLVAVLMAVPLSSCADDTDAVTDVTPTTASPGSPTTTIAEATSTTEPDPAYRSWIANVRTDLGSIVIHDSPGGPQLQLDVAGNGSVKPVAIDNPLPSGAPTTFLVKERGVEATGVLWHEVYLPVRPNGSTGWVADADVVLTNTDMSATINLTTHQLDLSDQGAVIASYPVASGATATPTPTGTFYVKELVEPPQANGTYGPLAYGLSAHSDVLIDTEAFADGVIGIHGTNQPALIGTDVSHGCVRVRNDDVLDLERRQVPLGMPVTIIA